MKFKNPLIAVKDMERSKAFYKEVLGLRMTLDFGSNITLTGGLSLQTKESWREFIEKDDKAIVLKANNGELYFEEDDFDAFAEKLASIPDIEYVHPVREHSWGQRAVRFYDPDGHIIEVGENIKVVCRRFLESGLTEEETAERMDVPIKFVKACQR
ncbi:VOC family protein [Anaerovorax odorimutans]|uniref:VOC family protein n=1 Tax=Anaerovorax odorimutans TaxID=109327 RepID=A0ABT1RNY7_9FIRM|nr:VOC family protein [Anaerovorax odorimutans]MCQ4636907.1 VOC family protein [Anaerovorax odorimutans]